MKQSVSWSTKSDPYTKNLLRIYITIPGALFMWSRLGRPVLSTFFTPKVNQDTLVSVKTTKTNNWELCLQMATSTNSLDLKSYDSSSTTAVLYQLAFIIGTHS